MAAGRHGDCLDRDFRPRDPDIEASRRKDLSKDRIREGERQKGSDPFDYGHRVKDIKDREVVKASRSSSSSTGNSSGGSEGRARYRREQHGVFVDREPGELSSGSSGSEDHDAPQSMMLADDGVHLETGVSASPPRKRKFSPIIWDKDINKKSNVATLAGENNSSVSGPLPPPPLLPEGFVTSSSVNPVSSLGNLPQTDDKSFLVVDHLQHLSNGQETGQIEEDDEYMPARNISSSRWADAYDLKDDEIKHSKVESGSWRRKGTLNSGVLHKKVPTPEFGEVDIREDSNTAVARPSDSDYEDEFEENDIIGKDYMDVDEDGTEKGTTHQSDKEIDEEDNTNKTPERVQPPQRSINMLQSCRSVDEFERLNKIDEGTYGVVYRAKDKKTGEVVALKKVKMEKEREGFPLTSLREINILLSFHHPSIVDVKEVVVGSSLDSIFMVMEYMDHDLKGLMETMKQSFSQSEVKCLMLQLLEGVKYLHDNWVLHRDLKTSNLLFNNRGELKICDFGLSRQYGSPLKPYTHLVVTLWYRSPELLLGIKEYSTAIDMWSLGCIMAELLAKEPLFNGKTEFDQLDKIFRILGTPNETIWPGFTKLPGVKVNFVKQPYNRLREKFPPTSFSGRPTLSERGFDLLNKLLTYDPEKRITAEQALNHEWFKEVPLPKSKDFMPTFPAQHAQDRRLRRILKSPDPLEEQRQRELQQGGIALGSLFN